jgi:hypothetical protein
VARCPEAQSLEVQERGRRTHAPRARIVTTVTTAQNKVGRAASANDEPLEHEAHRTLADSVEAVFILVAFRRFTQFSDNQRERTHSCNEKACGYDHD